MRRLPVLRMTILAVALIGSCRPSAADDKFTCPTTKPTPVTFEPNGAFSGRAAKLFGDERLFTLFPGNWKYAQRQEHRYRVPKIVWGSNVYDLTKERQESALTITGRRLDATSGPLEFNRAYTAWIGNDFFITSGFYVPTLGCWEVTGHFHGADLKIVVDLK
jgi:hypothetical protein